MNQPSLVQYILRSDCDEVAASFQTVIDGMGIGRVERVSFDSNQIESSPNRAVVHIVDFSRASQSENFSLWEARLSAGFLGPVSVIAPPLKGSLFLRWIQLGVVEIFDWPLENGQLHSGLKRLETECLEVESRLSEYRTLREKFQSITEKEASVLTFVLEGVPNKTIAVRLGVCERTVEARRQKICQKFGVFRLPDIIALCDRYRALQRDLFPNESPEMKERCWHNSHSGKSPVLRSA